MGLGEPLYSPRDWEPFQNLQRTEYFSFFLRDKFFFLVLEIRARALCRPGMCFAKVLFSAPDETILTRVLAYNAWPFKVGDPRSEAGQSLGVVGSCC